MPLAGEASTSESWHTLPGGWNRPVAPDYYVRLNVVPEAEDGVIRAAYLALAKRYHPDAATSASPHDSGKFQLIKEAYEVLSDPGRRGQYDKHHGRQRRLAVQREKFEQALRAREQAERRSRPRAGNRWRSAFNLLVFSVGGFVVAALAFGQIKVPGFDRPAANTELAMQRANDQELTELLSALYKAQGEAQAYQELLAQERDRSGALEEQLASRQDARPTAHQTASLPPQTVEPTPSATDGKPAETPIAAAQPGAAAGQDDASAPGGETRLSPELDLTHAAAMDTPAADPLPTSDKPMLPTEDRPTTAVSTTVSEQPGNPESIRLMTRAGLLLEQRNIGVARTVLERAADLGSARALFLLAETYDPAVLSAWGTFGTRGDVAKAQELYSKAFAGGIREARERLNVSR
jgi:curved DNA-binding protein CbpA